MPRLRRIVPDNSIQHVLNRGNRRQTVFHNDDDYAQFFSLLADTLDYTPLQIFAACVMPNHFHMVVRAESQAELSAYMQRFMSTHVRRHHKRYGTTGQGHIWQGRYKNFMVQDGVHLLNVLRYVEANALRAGLVSEAGEWKWSTVVRRYAPDGRAFLSNWPVPKPREWRSYVNYEIEAEELVRLQNAVRRGCPYGEPDYVAEMVERYGLEATCNDRGRERSGRKKQIVAVSRFL
jgi:putative transposase